MSQFDEFSSCDFLHVKRYLFTQCQYNLISIFQVKGLRHIHQISLVKFFKSQPYLPFQVRQQMPYITMGMSISKGFSFLVLNFYIHCRPPPHKKLQCKCFVGFSTQLQEIFTLKIFLGKIISLNNNTIYQLHRHIKVCRTIPLIVKYLGCLHIFLL